VGLGTIFKLGDVYNLRGITTVQEIIGRELSII